MNGTKFVLDTNVIIDFLDSRITLEDFKDVAEGVWCCASFITRMELLSQTGIQPDEVSPAFTIFSRKMFLLFRLIAMWYKIMRKECKLAQRKSA
jgi:hypothetical protein